MTGLEWILFIPVTAAIAALLLQKRPPLQRMLAIVQTTAVGFLSAFLLNRVLTDGAIVVEVGGWKAPYGIILMGDVFSLLMVLISNWVATAVIVGGFTREEDPAKSGMVYPLVNFLMLGVNGAFITGDLFNLYVWFEVMMLSSFALMAIGGSSLQLQGAIKYAAINLLASVFFLSGVGILYGKLGSLNLAHLSMLIAEHEDGSSIVLSTSALFLTAFGIKSALFPFFFWLPASYHVPGHMVSALFAGLLTKVGVYVLFRVFGLLFWGEDSWNSTLFLSIGILTMVTGVLGAMVQFDFRRLLSFHIISQIGYMVAGFALGSTAAVAAAIFFMIHNMFAKTALFIVAGSVERTCGQSNLKKIGGYYRASLLLTLSFALAALALAGLPPFSGFWAKLMIFREGLELEHYFLVTMGVIVGMGTLYSMCKIWSEAFLKNSPEDTCSMIPNYKLEPRTMVSLTILLLGTLLMSIAVDPVYQVCLSAAESLTNPELYIKEVLSDRF